mmetsp:Transcript_22228/g.52535  ORF Transcript_22228/g.52535 Transcript_22228/m.52535 type:complete len:210 (-) Transcript_22228:977-1606(-)
MCTQPSKSSFGLPSSASSSSSSLSFFFLSFFFLSPSSSSPSLAFSRSTIPIPGSTLTTVAFSKIAPTLTPFFTNTGGVRSRMWGRMERATALAPMSTWMMRAMTFCFSRYPAVMGLNASPEESRLVGALRREGRWKSSMVPMKEERKRTTRPVGSTFSTPHVTSIPGCRASRENSSTSLVTAPAISASSSVRVASLPPTLTRFTTPSTS